MKGIYLLFMRQAARQSAVFLVATAAGLIAVQQFFFHRSGLGSYFALGLVWLAIGAYQASQCMPRNINWIAIMPFSRPKLLLLTSLINSSILLMASLCFVLVVVTVDLVKFGGLHNASVVWSTFANFVLYFYRKLFTYPTAFAWATTFLVGSYAFALLTSPTWRGTHQTLSLRTFLSQLWNAEEPQKQTYYRTWLFIVCIFAIAARDYFLAPFGVFGLFLLVMAKLCPRMWRVAVNISPREQRVATACLFALALLQLGWVYGLERKALRSPATDERVRAIEFLGPFAGQLSQESLAEILESNISKDSVISVGNTYLALFHSGEKILADRDSAISFTDAVENKDGLSPLLKTIELFEPASLGKAELRALFGAMSPLSRDPRETRIFLMMLGAKLSVAELKEFAVSSNEAENRYALIRARYERDPSLVDVIQKQMQNYGDEVVYAALSTLSLMRGQKVTLDDWRQVRGGRSLAVSFFEPRCDGLTFESLEQLSAQQVSLLNVCLRERADRADLFLLEDIEDAGWIAPPLSSFQKSIVSEVFEVADY